MVHGGLHTLPAVSSPVTLNAPSWPFSYAMGPSVVGRGLHALALCWCTCVGLWHPKAGNAVPGCHMPRVPHIIRPVRCRGTLLTPLPLSHSSPVPRLHSALVIQPSSAMTQRYMVGMGLMVKLHALLGLVVPGLCIPLVYAVLLSTILLRVGVHLTWCCYGRCSSSTLVGATSPLLISSPNATLSAPLCTSYASVCSAILSHLNA
jgi:hypothetical protein